MPSRKNATTTTSTGFAELERMAFRFDPGRSVGIGGKETRRPRPVPRLRLALLGRGAGASPHTSIVDYIPS